MNIDAMSLTILDTVAKQIAWYKSNGTTLGPFMAIKHTTVTGMLATMGSKLDTNLYELIIDDLARASNLGIEFIHLRIRLVEMLESLTRKELQDGTAGAQ